MDKKYWVLYKIDGDTVEDIISNHPFEFIINLRIEFSKNERTYNYVSPDKIILLNYKEIESDEVFQCEKYLDNLNSL